MIMPNLHGHHIRESHITDILFLLNFVAICVHASLHIFTMSYAFSYEETQKPVTGKSNYSCPFPNALVCK